MVKIEEMAVPMSVVFKALNKFVACRLSLYIAARPAATDIWTEITEKVEEHHRLFHPMRGQLLKTGLQNSRFFKQVQSY